MDLVLGFTSWFGNSKRGQPHGVGLLKKFHPSEFPLSHLGLTWIEKFQPLEFSAEPSPTEIL